MKKYLWSKLSLQIIFEKDTQLSNFKPFFKCVCEWDYVGEEYYMEFSLKYLISLEILPMTCLIV